MTRGRHRRHFCHLDASVSGTAGIAFPLCNQVKGQPSLCCPARTPAPRYSRSSSRSPRGSLISGGKLPARAHRFCMVDHTPDPVVHIAGGALYRKELFGVTKTGNASRYVSTAAAKSAASVSEALPTCLNNAQFNIARIIEETKPAARPKCTRVRQSPPKS